VERKIRKTKEGDDETIDADGTPNEAELRGHRSWIAKERETMSQRWNTSARGMQQLAIPVAVLFLLSLARPTLAAGPEGQMQKALDAVAAVLKDPSLQGPDKQAERRQRVRQIILDTFDFEEMAKPALGPYRDRLTPPQRTEFISLFGTLFERSYNSLVLQFLADRQTIYGSEAITRNRAMVQTTLVDQKTNGELPVEYRLIDKDQWWAVFDVVVDGVSLAQNYRAQFEQIIRSSSYDALLQRINTKVEQEAS
jgi:phospholipid transport system substrate-binding protein